MKYHPDKNSGDKEAEKKFQQLKEAKEVLCDPEKRQMYDKWKNSGLQITYKNWIGMKEHVVCLKIESFANKKIYCTYNLYSNNRCIGQILKRRTACSRKTHLADQVIYRLKGTHS